MRQQQITQHKRFVPYGTHPNFCFAKTSFMLEPLGDISIGDQVEKRNPQGVKKWNDKR